MNNGPILVALCARPKSGKSTIQKFLEEDFGILPIDDGEVLRRHVMELFDLSLEDVTTQQGKENHTLIQGVDWENRKVIGEYGAILEERFGELTVPNWALRQADKLWKEQQENKRNPRGFSFGSVRRNQGKAYNARGALVIEITRPGIAPTGNIWDEYEPGWITHRFANDGSLETLRRDFGVFFTSILETDYRIAA